MKKIFLLLALCVPLIAAAASISGVVREQSSNDPIAYATISLLNADSTLIAGTISNDNGNFTIDASAGTYILQVSYVGYHVVYRNISLQQESVELGYIYLSEETATIEEVEVRADKPLIQRRVDKIVMNVSSSPLAVGSSGIDMLRIAPGVVIDKDGNITVNGKRVEVYIDDRPTYMSGEQLKSLLQGTDATTIEKIEIITNPSAKYDAAGQGGIINIKLKKNKSVGTNGSLSASYGGMYFEQIHQYLQSERVSFNLNHRGLKTYTSFAISQSYRENADLQTSYMQQPLYGDTMRSTNSALSSDQWQYYTARLSNDWYIDDKNTFGFMVAAPITLTNNQTATHMANDLILLGSDTIQESSSRANGRSFMPRIMANLNYTYVFSDSLSRELTINADYYRHNSNRSNPQSNTIYKLNKAYINPLPDKLDINTQQYIDIATVKADFQTMFWKTGMIECGAKWLMSHTDNSMTQDSVMPDYRSISQTAYDYTEHVAALYISASKQFGEQWTVKLGLRGELTASHGIYQKDGQTKTVDVKPYFNLFPTAIVGYNPNENWSLNLNYTRRIYRPDYYNLNPFVSYESSHSYWCGNPELKPEFSNNLSFSVGWSRYVSVEFLFSHHSDVITLRPEITENGDLKSTYMNFGTEMSIGGSLSLTEIPIVPKFKTDEQGKRTLDGAWLALTVNIGMYDHINQADPAVDANYGTRHAFHSNYQGMLNAYLPKDWRISAYVWGATPSTYNYDHWKGGYIIGAGIQKSWEDKGLTLSLDVDDLVRSLRFTGGAYGMADGYIANYDYTTFMQSVNIGISWRFGTRLQHRYRNVGDDDDTDRLGGGGKSKGGL